MTTRSIKEWKGNITMNSTYATKTYLNLEIPEAVEFLTRYKLQVDVQDEIGFIKVIMFDSQLQMLINNTTKTTKDLSEKNNDEIAAAYYFETPIQTIERKGTTAKRSSLADKELDDSQNNKRTKKKYQPFYGYSSTSATP
ncbi:hypothetical protein GIB67_028535, partial [Kingdonia uniflora]